MGVLLQEKNFQHRKMLLLQPSTYLVYWLFPRIAVGYRPSVEADVS